LQTRVKVLTEAWQSTRVRVSIEDCTPRTAVIAAFGAEPTPSQHELLAHAMLDLSGNGTCGVDVISRPSFSRDGVWCVPLADPPRLGLGLGAV